MEPDLQARSGLAATIALTGESLPVASESLDEAILRPRRTIVARIREGLLLAWSYLENGNTRFQSFFMSTTVQPRFGASVSALSSRPNGDLRS